MKHRIKQIIWALKVGFLFCPILFIFYIVVQVIRATLVVYVTLEIGEIINNLTDNLLTLDSFNSTFSELLTFALLNVVLMVLVELRWRISDDFLPIRARYGATQRLLNTTKYIPLQCFDKSDFCDEYSRYCTGIHNLHKFVSLIVMQVVQVYALLLTVIKLWQMHFVFGMLTAILFIICCISTRQMVEIQDQMRKETTVYRRKADYLNTMFSGSYNRDTRLLGLKDLFIHQWRENKNKIVELEVEGGKKVDKHFATLEFIRSGIVPMVVLIISVYFVYIKKILTGDLYSVWQLSKDVCGNAGELYQSLIQIGKRFKEVEETYNFENKLQEYKREECVALPQSDMSAPAISIQNVSFSYLEGKDVVRHASLQIEKGETVALIGDNGSGKSTLIKLLLGLYKPQSGCIHVFGKDTRYCGSEYLRGKIGVAFQDYCSYPFSLRENVGFGSVENSNDSKKIEAALIQAGAENILKKVGSLDRPLSRKLSENGMELSGGEWQKVALSRAFFADKDIMIFDEPAARLDPLSEEKQFDAIRLNAEDKTVILVSHRVGFARLADKIVVLKNGLIKEVGTHEELIALKGLYYKMFTTQKKLYEKGDEPT